jgi:hypothetical protein
MHFVALCMVVGSAFLLFFEKIHQLTCQLQLSGLLGVTFSKIVVITVGGNTTSNAGLVFSPESVVADLGDTVFFNCELLPCFIIFCDFDALD